MKAKLTISPPCGHFGYQWELTWSGILITSDKHFDGYASRNSAKRAAMNAARKLGLTVEEVES